MKNSNLTFHTSQKFLKPLITSREKVVTTSSKNLNSSSSKKQLDVGEISALPLTSRTNFNRYEKDDVYSPIAIESTPKLGLIKSK
jgi:hypothetical protein